VADSKPKRDGEGLSLQTLVIAAVASATAAIVTSHFWKAGTAITAAMTPVIVAIVREALQKPIESDLVRKPVKIAASAITAPGQARARERRFQQRAAREPARTPAGAPPPPPPPASPRERPRVPLREDGKTQEGLTPGDVVLTGPRRTYSQRRPRRLKLAIVTGLLAFAIAAVVLTVPELLFGGAVASHHSTTFFGGGSSHAAKSPTKSSGQQKGNQGTTTTPNTGKQTTTQQSTTPQSTTPSPTTSQPQQTPAPQAPAPAAPPSSGGGAPPANPSSP
jgi:hypothetical protein